MTGRGACLLAARSAAWWWQAGWAAATLCDLGFGVGGLLFWVMLGAAALAVTFHRVWVCLAWLEAQPTV